LVEVENYQGEKAFDKRQHNVNNNNSNNTIIIIISGLPWKVGAVLSEILKSPLNYTTKERPIQTDVPCFRRNSTFRPDQTRMLNELKGDYRYNCAPLNEEAQFP
jgi:hypothetical protein